MLLLYSAILMCSCVTIYPKKKREWVNHDVPVNRYNPVAATCWQVHMINGVCVLTPCFRWKWHVVTHQTAQKSQYENWKREISLEKRPCWGRQFTSMYHSLVKEHPLAEHLTSLLKRGVGTLSSVSAFNHKRVPMSCLQQFDALEANNWINRNAQNGATSGLSSPDDTQHSEQHHISISLWAWCTPLCAPHYLCALPKAAS